MFKKLRQYSTISLCSLLLASCFSVKYPEQQTYMLNIAMPQQEKITTKHNLLMIATPTIAAQFQNNTFVYRTSAIHYLTDYYNAFFIPPNLQIKQLITEYLSHAGLFQQVVGQSNIMRADLILQTEITALYADYRNSNYPKGVIAMQFMLLNKEAKKSEILFNTTFSETIPLQQKDSQSLVLAWNQGLQKILKQLTVKLKTVTSPASI